MVKIECDVWEQKQMIEYLEFAFEKRKEEYEDGKITRECLEFERNKINKLLKIVKGKEYDGYLLKAKSERRKHLVTDIYKELNDAEREIMRLPEVR